jgi:hypothetical protein
MDIKKGGNKMFGISRGQVQSIKERYKVGTRIKLNHMNDSQAVPSGTLGTVAYVDDIGTIHMNWDNGRSLGLVVGEDDFSIVS